MFKFENKTIDEFRKEVSKFIGKKVVVRCGIKLEIESVSDVINMEMPTFSNLSFSHNGEVDWSKSTKTVEVVGFTVTLIQKNGEMKMSTPLNIMIDRRDRKKKHFSTNYDSISIY